jgi:pimeloyl-ACP methyl ester carboxylesterase
MTDDTLNQTITLKDGRVLGFAQYGDRQGKVVIHFNGSGGSRLEHPADETILTDLGIHFVSTDRAGHGISDPQPDRKLLDWPEDISQLADHLGTHKFYVMGWSAGGPHALACAYALPERVLAGAIISGLAPPDRPHPYEGLPTPNKALMIIARSFPSLVYPFRRIARGTIMGEPAEAGEKLAASFPPEDRHLIDETNSGELLVRDIQEGYRQGWAGPAQDDIIINSPWGFDIQDIQQRIDVWQGELDKNVPLNQGLYQHEHLPNSRLHVMQGQAHVYLLAEWPQVLQALVNKD